MRVRAAFQIVASWLFILGFGVGASAVTLVTLGVFSRRLSPFMLRFWGRTMLKIAGVTYEVQGAEHIDADTMKIAPFNHRSVLDAFLVTAVMPPGSVAAIKREVLYYGVVGVTVYLLGFLLIDRGNSDRARRTMNNTARRMSKRRLTVFLGPEGTRGKTADLLPFKKGTLRLALVSRAPIVPMLIDGAFELQPSSRWTTRPGHVVIRFLPARPTDHITEATIGEETDALHDLYVRELARLRADRLASGKAILAAA